MLEVDCALVGGDPKTRSVQMRGTAYLRRLSK
jgi:hypothetical protein